MNIILYACKIYLETHVFIFSCLFKCKVYTYQYLTPFRVLLQLPVCTRKITKHWTAGMALYNIGVSFHCY